MPEPLSRYRTVSRRALLRSSLIGIAVVAVPGVAVALNRQSNKVSTKGPVNAATDVTAVTTVPPSSAATGSVPGRPPSPAPAAGEGGAGSFDGANEVVVKFSYQATDAAFVKNPYIAVWFEDAAGRLVKTAGVYFQRGRGDKWLDHLTRWFSANQSRIAGGGADRIATTSSATRVPGTYSFAWDGTDDQDTPVKLGSYFVCIEAAREHGPYQLIREACDLAALKTSPLPDKGDLVNATLTVRAKA